MRLLVGVLTLLLSTQAFAIELFSGDEERSTNRRSSGKPSLEQRVQLLERRINTLSSIVLRLDSLQQEMQQLRGEVELQNHAMERMQQRQTDLYTDLEQRITGDAGAPLAGQQMQPQPGQMPAQAPAAPTAAVKTPQKVVPPADTGVPRREPTWQSAPIAAAPAKPVQPAPVPAKPVAAPGRARTIQQAPVITTTTTTRQPQGQLRSTQIAAAPASIGSKAEKSSYQKAFNLLMDRKYDQAQKSFRAFLKAYPGSRLADNAQYWLAEANYVTRNFDTALVEFENVVQGYPSSDKISDALLKIGYIQYEKRQWGQARETLGSLVSRYPNSTASQLAKKRLDKMRGQGR